MENELNKKRPLSEEDLEKVTGGAIHVLEEAVYECPKCGRNILESQYSKHVSTCKGKSE